MAYEPHLPDFRKFYHIPRDGHCPVLVVGGVRVPALPLLLEGGCLDPFPLAFLLEGVPPSLPCGLEVPLGVGQGEGVDLLEEVTFLFERGDLRQVPVCSSLGLHPGCVLTGEFDVAVVDEARASEAAGEELHLLLVRQQPVLVCNASRFHSLFFPLVLHVVVEGVEGHVAHGCEIVARGPEGVAPQLVVQFLGEFLPEVLGGVSLEKVDVLGEVGAGFGRYEEMDMVVPTFLIDDLHPLRPGHEGGEFLEAFAQPLVGEALPLVFDTDDEMVSQRIHSVI